MCIDGVLRRGVCAFGDLAGLARVCGIGAGMLVGDPGEQFGLVGQQCGVLGGVGGGVAAECR
ncbi:MAG TPA: hypothetical protein VNO31_04785 [Umezawaea sp.]|jgi:hypothetical protein|nr:hypothetical protein [Umezawaea sp.]